MHGKNEFSKTRPAAVFPSFFVSSSSSVSLRFCMVGVVLQG